MPIIELERLFEKYPRAIGQMPMRFNSHRFIRHLARLNQGVFIEVLNAYRNKRNPFQVAHGILSNQLNKFPNLVRYVGKESSTDIFGQSNRCAVWSRVNG